MPADSNEGIPYPAAAALVLRALFLFLDRAPPMSPVGDIVLRVTRNTRAHTLSFFLSWSANRHDAAMIFDAAANGFCEPNFHTNTIIYSYVEVRYEASVRKHKKKRKSAQLWSCLQASAVHDNLSRTSFSFSEFAEQ